MTGTAYSATRIQAFYPIIRLSSIPLCICRHTTDEFDKIATKA